MTKPRHERWSFTVDERARVPFAMIGVLLLVSSITVVYALESRSDPEPQIDQSLAVDQTEASAQAEFRQAVMRATDDAAAAPLTRTSNTPLGRAIDADSADGATTKFDSYVKLRVFAEAERSLPNAGHQASAGVETSVDVGEVDWESQSSVESALDRVELNHAGNDGGMEYGLLEASIEDVTITLERDGDVIDEYERDVTVTVASTVFELREKTQEFEDELNRNFNPSNGYSGLGDYFGARLYALSWGKAWTDRLNKTPSQRKFHNITPNDHTEVLANDAVFSVQRNVFGSADPYEKRVMRGPMICLAEDLLQDGASFYDRDSLPVDPEQLCNNEYVFGSVDGDVKEPPTAKKIVMELLGNKAQMNHDLHLHPIASIAFFETSTKKYTEAGDFASELRESDRFNQDYVDTFYSDSLAGTGGGDSFSGDNPVEEFSGGSLYEDVNENEEAISGIIDDLYTVTLDASADNDRSGGPLPSTEQPTENHTDKLNSTYKFKDYSADVTFDERTDSYSNGRQRTFATAEVTYTVDIRELATWGNESDENVTDKRVRTDWKPFTFTSSHEIDGEFAGDIGADRLGVNTALSDGGGSPGPPAFEQENWGEVPRKALEERFGTTSELILESRIESQHETIETTSDFEDAIGYSSSLPDISPELADGYRTALAAWLADDLRKVHLDLVKRGEPQNVSFMDMTSGNSPFRDFESTIRKEKGDTVYKKTGRNSPYANAPDLARAEVRRVYFENALHRTDYLAEKHEDKINATDSALSGNFFDNFMEESLGFVQDMMAGDLSEERSTAEGSPLLDEVHFQVDGSPTYLPIETVNRSTVPAVRSHNGTSSLLKPKNAEHSAMSASYANIFGYPGFPLLPWPSLFYLQMDGTLVQLTGEYARFEITATNGDDAATTGATTLVREKAPVQVMTADGAKDVGRVDPIRFHSSAMMMVMVPAPTLMSTGTPGVGEFHNFEDNVDQFGCSNTWDYTGPDFTSGKAVSDRNCDNSTVSNLAEQLIRDLSP